MAARKSAIKIMLWGAARSKTTGGWKAVIFTKGNKYYLNLAFPGMGKKDHEDVAGYHVSQMRRMVKFKGFTFKKIA